MQGYTQEKILTHTGISSGHRSLRGVFKINAIGYKYPPNDYRSKLNLDTWSLDTTNPDKTLLIIKQNLRVYDRETRNGKSTFAIRVKYKYNKNYDPTYKQESSAGFEI